MGIEEYFLFSRINWGRKSENLKGIAKDIDIGIDTFIFIDDNSFEREDVATVLPQVEVLDETSLTGLLDHPRLQGSASAEAKNRRLMYRQAAVRSVAAQEFCEDYIGFLRSCQMRVEVRLPEPETGSEFANSCSGQISSISQAVSTKTKRLELSWPTAGSKNGFSVMTTSTVRVALSGSVSSCGFHGSVRVVDFMLSCRVQGRFV